MCDILRNSRSCCQGSLRRLLALCPQHRTRPAVVPEISGRSQAAAHARSAHQPCWRLIKQFHSEEMHSHHIGSGGRYLVTSTTAILEDFARDLSPPARMGNLWERDMLCCSSMDFLRCCHLRPINLSGLRHLMFDDVPRPCRNFHTSIVSTSSQIAISTSVRVKRGKWEIRNCRNKRPQPLSFQQLRFKCFHSSNGVAGVRLPMSSSRSTWFACIILYILRRGVELLWRLSLVDVVHQGRMIPVYDSYDVVPSDSNNSFSVYLNCEWRYDSSLSQPIDLVTLNSTM